MKLKLACFLIGAGVIPLFYFNLFLGGRWPVDAYRWTAAGLELRLPQVEFRVWRRFGWLRPWQDQSTLLLTYQGEVRPGPSPMFLGPLDSTSGVSISPRRLGSH